MPPIRINDTQLLARLTEAFRLYGYEGASLSRISELTGLQRASLYHRFPGGKEQMAQAVLEWITEQFKNHVLEPLSQPGDPADRVREMARRLDDFYQAGGQSCVLDTLSLRDATPGVRHMVEICFSGWHDAMSAIAREAGASNALASRRAADAMVQVQGALVFARVTQDRGPFRRALDALPSILLEQT